MNAEHFTRIDLIDRIFDYEHNQYVIILRRIRIKRLILCWQCVCAVHSQRVTELNERYNSCRAKTAECVAAAVRRKEDVSSLTDAYFKHFLSVEIHSPLYKFWVN